MYNAHWSIEAHDGVCEQLEKELNAHFTVDKYDDLICLTAPLLCTPVIEETINRISRENRDATMMVNYSVAMGSAIHRIMSMVVNAQEAVLIDAVEAV